MKTSAEHLFVSRIAQPERRCTLPHGFFFFCPTCEATTSANLPAMIHFTMIYFPIGAIVIKGCVKITTAVCTTMVEIIITLLIFSDPVPFSGSVFFVFGQLFLNSKQRLSASIGLWHVIEKNARCLAHRCQISKR